MTMLQRAANRIASLVVKGLISAVNDSDELQLVKVSTTADEVIEDVERVQQYGITSVPPEGSEAIVIFMNGDRSEGVVIGCDSAAVRVKELSDGDVALYSKHGQQILMDDTTNITATQDGTFNVGSGSDFVALSAKVDLLWTTFWNMFTAWVPQATDGGAALKTQFMASFPTTPSSVASTNLKAD